MLQIVYNVNDRRKGRYLLFASSRLARRKRMVFRACTEKANAFYEQVPTTEAVKAVEAIWVNKVISISKSIIIKKIGALVKGLLFSLLINYLIYLKLLVYKSPLNMVFL